MSLKHKSTSALIREAAKLLAKNAKTMHEV
jgi:hypothetical protein